MEIEESRQKPVLTFFRRIKNSIIAGILSVLLIQGVLFLIGLGSIVKYYDHMIVIFVILISILFGWYSGENFIRYISHKIYSIWDLLGFFK